MVNFPNLTIVLTENLVIHEKHDHQRTVPLIWGMKSTNIIRNPPIVAPLDDGSDRYMVLDGANRTMAIKKMGIPHIIVQIIDPTDQGLRLHSWNHVVWEHNPIRFMKNLAEIPGIHLALSRSPNSKPDIYQTSHLAVLHNCKGRMYLLETDARDLRTRLQLLNNLVDCYRERGRLDRTSSEEVDFLRQAYPSFCGLIIFPHFSLHDLFQLSGKGYLLPTGITRFTISPRALHINFPLTELMSNNTIEEKNEHLRASIQEKINRKSVRYYPEPTYIFDESNE